jgi:hypothetical protein
LTSIYVHFKIWANHTHKRVVGTPFSLQRALGLSLYSGTLEQAGAKGWLSHTYEQYAHFLVARKRCQGTYEQMQLAQAATSIFTANTQSDHAGGVTKSNDSRRNVRE